MRDGDRNGRAIGVRFRRKGQPWTGGRRVHGRLPLDGCALGTMPAPTSKPMDPRPLRVISSDTFLRGKMIREGLAYWRKTSNTRRGRRRCWTWHSAIRPSQRWAGMIHSERGKTELSDLGFGAIRRMRAVLRDTNHRQIRLTLVNHWVGSLRGSRCYQGQWRNGVPARGRVEPRVRARTCRPLHRSVSS